MILFHHPINDKTELPATLYHINNGETELPAVVQDAGKVLSQERELAPLINSAVTQYEASGKHSRGTCANAANAQLQLSAVSCARSRFLSFTVDCV